MSITPSSCPSDDKSDVDEVVVNESILWRWGVPFTLRLLFVFILLTELLFVVFIGTTFSIDSESRGVE